MGRLHHLILSQPKPQNNKGWSLGPWDGPGKCRNDGTLERGCYKNRGG